MKKRMISLLLASTMALGMLVGCGSKKTDQKYVDNGEKVTLTIGVPQNANVTSYDDNAFTNYLEKEANVELEFVSFSSNSTEYTQQLTLLVSGNEELPDVLVGFWGMDSYTVREFGEDEYFLDLSDLIENNAPNYKNQLKNLTEEEQKRIKEKGKHPESGEIYGMPFYTVELTDNLQNLMYINKAWLNKLGLNAPSTLEELNTVLTAFKTQDPNGNGKNDEIPILAKAGNDRDISTYIINAFVHYDSFNPYNVTDGKVWDPVSTDEYRQALIYARELCQKEYLSDMCYTLGATSEFKSLITPEDNVARVGIWCGHPSVWTNTDTEILDEYTALMPLGDATGKGGYTVVRPNQLSYCSFITEDCENPAAAMRFLDVFYKDETVTRMRHGEKDVDWKEGKGINSLGTESHVQVINANAFFSGNATWCMNVCGILTADNYLTGGNAVSEREAEIGRLSTESWDEVVTKGKRPEAVVTELVYNDEEYEVRSEYSTLYSDYVTSSRTKFIAGELDPSDDKEWNNYLTTLKSMGQDELLKVAQSAYDRK